MSFTPVKKIDDREERLISNAEAPKNVMSHINGSATRRGYNLKQGASFTDLIIDCVERGNIYKTETDEMFKLAYLLTVAKNTLEDDFETENPCFTLEDWKESD